MSDLDFDWKPLSDKQLTLFDWWRDVPGNPYKNLSYIIAHGSIRSGKTCRDKTNIMVSATI